MFKKLNLPVFDLSVDILQGEETYHNNRFSEYSIKDKLLFDEVVLKKLNFQIPPDIINLTKICYPGVGPHKDAYTVVLNYYICAGSDVTQFWKTKNEIHRDLLLKPTSFDIEELTRTESIISQVNDWYLLNTKEIHSVQMSTDNSARFILRFCWKYNRYDEILDSLSDYNTL